MRPFCPTRMLYDLKILMSMDCSLKLNLTLFGNMNVKCYLIVLHVDPSILAEVFLTRVVRFSKESSYSIGM